MTLTRNIRALFFLITLLWISQGRASVIITGTRVIYPQSSASVTVSLLNESSRPSLIQAWADNGDSNATPNDSRAPFVVTPPVFRMEPNTGQALRLTLTDPGLPKDRESVFWLNVLDIPPKPSQSTGNYLQMAIRTRIKIFVRPENLNLSVAEAAARMQWTRDGAAELTIHNPTPYHFSLTGISTGTAEAKTRLRVSGMVAPFSSLSLGKHTRGFSGTTLDVAYVNDFGSTARATIRRKDR